jgi:hypothetical protein
MSEIDLSSMATLIGLFGSLRAGSFNMALLRAAAGLMPDLTQFLAGFTRHN